MRFDKDRFIHRVCAKSASVSIRHSRCCTRSLEAAECNCALIYSDAVPTAEARPLAIVAALLDVLTERAHQRDVALPAVQVVARHVARVAVERAARRVRKRVPNRRRPPRLVPAALDLVRRRARAPDEVGGETVCARPLGSERDRSGGAAAQKIKRGRGGDEAPPALRASPRRDCSALTYC